MLVGFDDLGFAQSSFSLELQTLRNLFDVVPMLVLPAPQVLLSLFFGSQPLDGELVGTLDSEFQGFKVIAFHFFDGRTVKNNPISLHSCDSWSVHRGEFRRPIPCVYEELSPRFGGPARKPERDFVKCTAGNPIVSRNPDFLFNYPNYLDWFLFVRISLLH